MSDYNILTYGQRMNIYIDGNLTEFRHWRMTEPMGELHWWDKVAENYTFYGKTASGAIIDLPKCAITRGKNFIRVRTKLMVYELDAELDGE